MKIYIWHRHLSLIVILAAIGMAAEINAEVWLSGFVGDERCAEPHDKRSVRGVISLSGRGTSEMFNGCACGWYIADVHRVGRIAIPTNAALIVGLQVFTISDGKRLRHAEGREI